MGVSLTCAQIASAQSIPTTSGQQWVSTWDDEFNTGSTDLNGFSYDTVDTVGGGWGNNELETYTSSSQNVSVSGGALHIDAIATTANGHQSYTSGRIKTPNLFAQAYGLLEFRAKFPAGTGLWPALWMLPSPNSYGGWPNSGETDIFESKGDQPTLVQGSQHTGVDSGHLDNQTGTYSAPGGFSTGDFHTYDLKWAPGTTNNAGTFTWYVDGHQYETQHGSWVIPSGAPAGDKDAPFDKPFYMLINLAVGGNYVSNTVNLANGTYDMQVDYVRAYQSDFAGDANSNGIVNSADFTAMASHFGATGATWQQGDFNGDGVVNALDFNILADNFGKQSLPSWAISSPALGSAVPEPASMALGLIACSLITALRSARSRRQRP
jgi:beta-glucanase (GH16 family)